MESLLMASHFHTASLSSTTGRITWLQVRECPQKDTIPIQLVGTNKAEATQKRNGKEVVTAEAEVSKGGKVSTVKIIGTIVDGKDSARKLLTTRRDR